MMVVEEVALSGDQFSRSDKKTILTLGNKILLMNVSGGRSKCQFS